MQIICTTLQTYEPRQYPITQFLTGRMLFLTPNQQCQSKIITNKAVIPNKARQPTAVFHDEYCCHKLAQPVFLLLTNTQCIKDHSTFSIKAMYEYQIYKCADLVRYKSGSKALALISFLFHFPLFSNTLLWVKN